MIDTLRRAARDETFADAAARFWLFARGASAICARWSFLDALLPREYRRTVSG